MKDKLYKDMSPKVYESLRKILNYDKKRLIVLSKKRRNVFIEELDKIQNVNNIRIIKYLLILSFDKDFVIALKALNHLKRIIDNLTIKELLFFAEYFRSSYFYYYIDNEVEKKYKEANNYKLDLINRFNEEGIYILSVLTLHPNGYIREDALKKLSKYENGFKIKFIMLRINDWVREIRDVAKKEILKCIEYKYLKDIIECMPIIDRMKNWERDDYSDILYKLENFIANKRNYDILLDIYQKNKDILIKRILFDYLLKINTTDDLIINVGLRSKDVIIIRKAIKEIDKIINEDNIDMILETLKKNKNVPCKLAAINILERINDKNFVKEIIPFLYDNSFTVRDYTRYKLKNLGITNFREMYLREIDKNNYNLYGILSGIKDTGIKEDTKFILKYLNHEKVKIRKIVLSTICKLDIKEGIKYAIDKLTSNNVGESNNARRCLEKDILSVDEDIIFELFKGEGYKSHVYINLIKLISHYPKWISLEQFLKILIISNNTYIKMINHEIDVWIQKFNRSFTFPRKEQINNIRKMYMRLDSKLSNKNHIQLGSIIKRF
ncbi:hypothetical protein [Defluviitalea phaphyphila]|uniref:hypothetical protein n=1 Tax=Defluviitalea phaphyphila TaxID=1473580 RepID=UPI0007312998|nr:hypothetical protein [Defluviitalea phaphyphila]